MIEVAKELQDIDLFKSIFQSSVEGILVVDAGGTIMKANLASEKLFGYNLGELIDKKVELLIPNNFKKKHKAHREKYVKKPKARQMGKSLDLWGLKKDGAQFPLEISLSPTQINGKQVIIAFVFDVTIKKTKDALFSIRSNAFASASNGIVIADAKNLNKPIIYCNDAFTKITGYTQEEALGRNCNFLQNGDRDQKVIGIMKNAISKGETCNVIVRNYKKDGTLFWNEITITPVFDKAHKVTHFIGVQNEVTKKIQEENLKNQTQKILELIAQDKSIETISTKIIKIVETHFKDCMASILVLDKEDEALNKLSILNLSKEFTSYTKNLTLKSKIASFDADAFLKKEIRVSNINNNSLWEDQREIAIKKGLKACWSIPILSATKQILGIFTIHSRQSRKPSDEEKEIASDMSYLASIAIEAHNNIIILKKNKSELEKHAQKLEEKVMDRTKEVMATIEKLVASNLSLEDQIQETLEAEKSALASKSLSSAIAKNFPNGFIIVFNADFEMLLIEGEAIIQLGIDKMDFEDTTLDDITMFSEDEKNKLKQDILKTIAGKHLSFELEYKNNYFTVNTTPLQDENSFVSKALFVYNNITAQKKIETNVKIALKKEQELNELKSRFVSMASHEFRTPLSAIQTSAILISKQNEIGQEEKREKYVAQIKKNVKQLVVILNDFLSLSKLEEGKVIANKEPFDFVQFCKTLIKEVSMTKKIGRNIILLTPEKPLLLNLDSKLARPILMNLLSNAIKYSPKNTEITIKIEESEQFVSLEVQDEGIGIPEEEQDQLFDRFFRAKNAQNIQGTGLGLNIVKQYVDLMDGSISFKSKTNEGTTFLVKWPKPLK